MPKPVLPAPLVHISNHRTDCLAFRVYRVGEV